MKTYPLKSISLEEAKEKQFEFIDVITKKITGSEMLTRGDLGVNKDFNKPKMTLKVEEIIADYFHAEKAVLVRGAGTAAIRWGIYTALKGKHSRRVLVHKAPIYPTTLISLEMLQVEIIEADYNNLSSIDLLLKGESIDLAIVQYTRQKIEDSYDIEKVIQKIKEYNIPVLTDDNYAVMKVSKIGVELGANLSAFSMFKLLGPEGIGCLVGDEKYISTITNANYSGGGQVQGHEALDVLQGLVYAPVSLSIQAEVNNELLEILNSGKLSFIKSSYLVNAQSKVLIVEFHEDIAERILFFSEKLGALPNPVGAESKYEFLPLFYRVSGTFRKTDLSLERRMIRINPNRAGTETIIRILKQSYELVKEI